MKIIGLTLSGFRGVRDELSLELPKGFAVIAGRNGSGKSTVCDAIEFALTGDIRLSSQHKEKQEGIRDYIWWRGESPTAEPYVELVLADDNGQKYTIRRTQTNVHVSPDKAIEDLLCYKVAKLDAPLPQLCRTSILRDEEITQLSVDLKETDRFNFVQSALGTADFSTVEQKAKDVQRVLTEEVTRADHQYSTARTRVEHLTTQLSGARAELSKAEDVAGAEQVLRTELQTPGGSIDELITHAETSLADLRLHADALIRLYRRLEEFEKRRTTINSPEHLQAAETLITQVELIKTQVTAAEQEAKVVAEELARAQAENPRTVSLALLREHGARIGLVDGRCPLCGSDQSEDSFAAHVAELAATIKKSNENLAALTNKSAEQAIQLSKAQADLARISSQLASLRQQEKDLTSEESTLAAEARRLGIESNDPTMMSRGTISRETETSRGRIVRVERALAVLQASRATLLVSSLEQDLKGARDLLVASDKRLTKVRAAANEIKEGLDTIRRVRGEYIDEQLAQLDPLLLELYQRLRPHVSWPDVRYRLRGDVRKMLSFEVGDGINPSFVFSSGQRRAAGLAFLLALHLSRNWCALKTLILDDPVQHIDDYRALHLTEVLSAIRATGRQVICTVEDESLAKLLSRRLRSDTEGAGAIIHMSYSSQKGVHVKAAARVPLLPNAILVPA